MMVSIFPPQWNFKLTWSLHKAKIISIFPPPWNFNLTWSLHKVKMIWRFPPWLGVSTRLRCYQNPHPHGTSNWLGVSTRLKVISKFTPPWNFKMTWSLHEVKMYQNSHPHGTSNWLGVSTKIRWYKNSHPHGTSYECPFGDYEVLGATRLEVVGMTSDVTERKKVLYCCCNRGVEWVSLFVTIFKRRIVKLGSRILLLEALIMQLGVSQFPDLPSEIRSTRETIST